MGKPAFGDSICMDFPGCHVDSYQNWDFSDPLGTWEGNFTTMLMSFNLACELKVPCEDVLQFKTSEWLGTAQLIGAAEVPAYYGVFFGWKDVVLLYQYPSHECVLAFEGSEKTDLAD